MCIRDSVGPAGTGKSQIAYAVARILKLPWTTLDMSSINDPEQLTGSSRIYANAKPVSYTHLETYYAVLTPEKASPSA